jgi:hypothetical protein
MNRIAWLLGSVAIVALTLWAFPAPSVGDGADPGVRVGARDAFNPVTAGEALPDGFRQLLPRDSISPVYDPTFVAADAVAWPPEAQVIGVEAGSEAKAYPVSFLTRREMVIDEIGGDPILVSW